MVAALETSSEPVRRLPFHRQKQKKKPKTKKNPHLDASLPEHCTTPPPLSLLPPPLLLFPACAVADAVHSPTGGCVRGLHPFQRSPWLIRRGYRHRLLLLLLLDLDIRASGGPRQGALPLRSPLPHRYDDDASASCSVICGGGGTVRCGEGGGDRNDGVAKYSASLPKQAQ